MGRIEPKQDCWTSDENIRKENNGHHDDAYRDFFPCHVGFVPVKKEWGGNASPLYNTSELLEDDQIAVTLGRIRVFLAYQHGDRTAQGGVQ